MAKQTQTISHRRESVNEQLWRGEIDVGVLIDLLKKVPSDGKVRIYGSKLQIVSPVGGKTYTLDRVR